MASQEFAKEHALRMGVSIGLATSAGLGEGELLATDLLLTRADRAMLHAKRQGGNQIAVWTPELELP